MRHPLQLAAAFFPLLALGAAGCDEVTPLDDAGRSAIDATASDAARDGAPEDAGACDPEPDPLACEDLTPDPSCEARWTVAIRGRVTRLEDGEGVEGARPQLCARVSPDDRLVCLIPPSTDADGRFTIVVPEEIRCLNRAAMRVVAPRRPLAALYCPFPLNGPETGDGVVVDLPAPFALTATTPAEAPPRGDAAAPREVRFDGDVTLTLAPDALATLDGYESLAGGPLPEEARGCFADGRPLLGAYAFTPEGPLGSPAALSLPNDAGLAPGATVDLFVLGGLETRLPDGTLVEEAELAAFGTATVSADGARIVSDAASLPYLSTVAWQAR